MTCQMWRLRRSSERRSDRHNGGLTRRETRWQESQGFGLQRAATILDEIGERSDIAPLREVGRRLKRTGATGETALLGDWRRPCC